tara:strand:- start:598 stop:1017 length:420 start_codon:yes stop_codon:yes gene_type:complete
MKIKITLLICKLVKGLPFNHPEFFQIYLDDNRQVPNKYISTKDESETVDEIVSKHFHIDPSWMYSEVCGFRKIDQSNAEVTYACTMPEVLGCNKFGEFFSPKRLQEQDIKIDPYYEQILSRTSKSFLRGTNSTANRNSL